MGKEIERKFLVDPDKFCPGNDFAQIRQGYLNDDPERSVRVRLSGNQAFLTIKGKPKGISRDEYEYPIPVPDAEELLGLSKGSLIEKTRFKIWFEGKLWEVDKFSGENEGLLLAEIELDSEEENIVFPGWVAVEVSGDPRFFNLYLSRFPYKLWPE
jgi:adenylate cyclase